MNEARNQRTAYKELTNALQRDCSEAEGISPKAEQTTNPRVTARQTSSKRLTEGVEARPKAELTMNPRVTA